LCLGSYESIGQSKKEQITLLNQRINQTSAEIDSSRLQNESELSSLQNDLETLKASNLDKETSLKELMESHKKDSMALIENKKSLSIKKTTLYRNAQLPKCSESDAINTNLLDRNEVIDDIGITFGPVLLWNYKYQDRLFSGWAKECDGNQLLKLVEYHNGLRTGNYSTYYYNGQLHERAQDLVIESYHPDGSFESKIKAQADATLFYNAQGQLFKKSNSSDIWVDNVKWTKNRDETYKNSVANWYSNDGQEIEYYESGVLIKKQRAGDGGCSQCPDHWCWQETYSIEGELNKREECQGSSILIKTFDRNGQLINEKKVPRSQYE
jgi:antitoxin component YwqK of YwqJK toxin-antitoxin module